MFSDKISYPKIFESYKTTIDSLADSTVSDGFREALATFFSDAEYCVKSIRTFFAVRMNSPIVGWSKTSEVRQVEVSDPQTAIKRMRPSIDIKGGIDFRMPPLCRRALLNVLMEIKPQGVELVDPLSMCVSPPVKKDATDKIISARCESDVCELKKIPHTERTMKDLLKYPYAIFDLFICRAHVLHSMQSCLGIPGIDCWIEQTYLFRGDTVEYRYFITGIAMDKKEGQLVNHLDVMFQSRIRGWEGQQRNVYPKLSKKALAGHRREAIAIRETLVDLWSHPGNEKYIKVANDRLMKLNSLIEGLGYHDEKK
jgi:hypothetical protein